MVLIKTKNLLRERGIILVLDKSKVFNHLALNIGIRRRA